jgi:hypothetical protein
MNIPALSSSVIAAAAAKEGHTTKDETGTLLKVMDIIP